MSATDLPTQEGEPKRWAGFSRWPLAAGAAAALLIVLIYVSPGWPAWARGLLKTAEVLLAAACAAERAVLLARSPRPKALLRERWIDLALVGATLAAVLVALGLRGRIFPAAAMYVLLSRAWRGVPRRMLATTLNVILALTGAAAVAALLLEYGFRPGRLPIGREGLHTMQTVVVAMFILDRVVRLESSVRHAKYLRENWVDFALIGAAGLLLAVGRGAAGQVVSAGTLYVIITQVYILATLMLRGVSVNLDLASSGAHPTWLLIGSFALMCLAGSGLLMLPTATPANQPISYEDALFTATSATCVTGLVVRDTGTEFTPFGQAVILAMIQAGGLGIMLFGTLLAVLIGRGLTLRGSEALGQMLVTEGIGHLARVAKFVVAMTVGMELLGAVLMYPMFAAPQGDHVPTFAQAAWNSVFHSVSSFCNAGFALYRTNMMHGLKEGWARPLRAHWQIHGVMAPLIVLGGVGFPVLQDCGRYVRQHVATALRRARARRLTPVAARRPKLSLHSKIVLTTTVVLIAAGAGGLMLFGHVRPHQGVGGEQDPLRKLTFGEAVFQSITARTAGFNTVDMQADLSNAGRLWLCGLMIVGGSPASTAGGMKTATLAVLALTAWSMVRRRNEVEAFRRSIGAELLRKTVTLAGLYVALVVLVTLLLLCVNLSSDDFLRVFFESCSACGTVGLSTGVTPTGNDMLAAKLILTGAMFAGRLGPLTLLVALTSTIRPARYSYPSEHIVIG